MKDFSNVLLITVDNDAEARLIYLIALKTGMTVYRSAQIHGARLDQESGIVAFAKIMNRKHVWTIEIPGEKTEEELRKLGFEIHTIDHHVYRNLDRAHDKKGMRLKSSLEQFLAMAEITDEDLIRLGFDPILVKGIAIMDDRYVQGLRKTGYTPESIEHVLRYREELERQIDLHYVERLKAATRAWKERINAKGFIVYQSDSELSVSRMVSTLAIRYGAESHPSIIFSRGGKQIFVLNVKPEQVQKLNQAFPNRYTWTYGAGRCWGVDNEKSDKKLWVSVTVDQLTNLLTQA